MIAERIDDGSLMLYYQTDPKPKLYIDIDLQAKRVRASWGASKPTNHPVYRYPVATLVPRAVNELLGLILPLARELATEIETHVIHGGTYHFPTKAGEDISYSIRREIETYVRRAPKVIKRSAAEWFRANAPKPKNAENVIIHEDLDGNLLILTGIVEYLQLLGVGRGPDTDS